MNAHTQTSFDRDLETVMQAVENMNRLIQDQLTATARIMMTLDAEGARAVMEHDREVNAAQVAVDAYIEEVFARRQPAAVDLRFLIGMGRVSVDLERIGDEIRNMARGVTELQTVDSSVLANRSTVSVALGTVSLMIAKAIRALRDHDGAVAREVILSDRMIDDVYKTTVRSLLTHMIEDPTVIGCGLAMNRIVRSLERIGDHAKNIAESVIYISEGADVRHEFYADPETPAAKMSAD